MSGDHQTKTSFFETLKHAILCRCPRCGRGQIFDGVLTLKDSCPSCGLTLADNDNGDGPAVFLIFILGFSLVPLALWVDYAFTPSLWVHAILWSVLGLGLTVGMLRPAKAYVLALIYKHRPDMWKNK